MRTTEMMPTNLPEVLRQIEDDTVRELRARAARRSGCINVPRASVLAFAPSRASDAEQMHLSACDGCRRLMAKIRASEHPPIAQLYAARWRQLPASDEQEVTSHTRQCSRCKLIAATAGIFPAEWIEGGYRRLQTALDATFVIPAAVGLNDSGVRRKRNYEAFLSPEWAVTIERERQELRVGVSRKADGERHERARVILIGPDEPVDVLVPLVPIREWWTGSAQVANRWNAIVDPVEISVVVAEV